MVGTKSLVNPPSPTFLYNVGNNSTQDCAEDLMRVEAKDLAESAVHYMLSKC